SELHRVFLGEARETLETLGRNIIDLERDAHNTDTVNSALRLAHTLKGSAAMVGFDRVRVLSHAMEDSLQAVRDGRVDLTADMTDMLLGALDVLARYVAAIGETGTEPSDSRSNEAVQRLRGFAETPSPPTSTIQQDPTPSDSPADVGGSLAEPDVVESEDEISEECIEEEITPEDFPRWSHDVFVELIRSLVALDGDASNTVIRGHFAVTAKRLAHGAELSGYDKIDDLASALAQLMCDGDSREPVSDDLLDVLNAGVDALGMALVRVRRDGHDRDPAVDEVTSLLSTVDLGDPRAEASDASDNGTAKNDERRGRSRTVEVDLDRLNRLLSLAAELVIVPNRLSAELERVVERIVRMTNGYATRSDRPEPSEQSQAVGLDAVPQTSDVNSTRRNGDWELAEITESIGEFGDATANLDQDIGRINTIAKDLHDEILRVRMVRVERAFDRIPLIIRDAARSENKRVNLVLEGADTEIDKNILEAMNNPLLHLIRNTVGHGIETPEERIAVGKPPIGEVRVKAEQDGNRIVVEVSDDGRGIDPDRIRSTAVRRELLTSEEATSLTDAEAINLIFRPGFTTVEAVNELSGRGVGLDVVRSVATRFNGSVIVESTVGRGTVFRVTLPLTLAIGQALLVEVCDTIFALPLPAVDRI
ncbi:MAG TPA: chemotaxis protein CheA, partial [Firmicutes bacterium]|nr:chemotaxis protein CheA [Bacillota bacterium]